MKTNKTLYHLYKRQEPRLSEQEFRKRWNRFMAEVKRDTGIRWGKRVTSNRLDQAIDDYRHILNGDMP